MPYREYQRACSKKCRERLPDRIEAQRLYDARPERRRNQNIARAVVVNPEQRRVNLRWALHKYGLTIEQYQARLAAQNGKCAICGKPPTPGGIKSASRLHVDHDHATKVNRGLLCSRCNPGLGYFQNDPALLQAAIDYLRRYL
jgi:hypothetical protein